MDNMGKLLVAKKECSEDSDCSKCIFGQMEDRCMLAELQMSLENDKNNVANIYIKKYKHEQLITCIYKRYVEKSTFITLCYTKQQKYVPLSYVELTEENCFPEYFEAGNPNPLDGYERAEEIKELMKELETNLKELAASYNYVQKNTDKGIVVCNVDF